MEHLIPQEPFAFMPQAMLGIIALAAIWILMRGADMLVEGAASLAQHFGIPKVIIGATIVSLGTTSPEAAVSVMAAWEGKAGLALGNAVGSIMADTGLIFGLGAVLVALPADRSVLMRQGWWKIGSGFLLALLCYILWWQQRDTAELGRGIGAMLLVLLLLYIFMSIRWSKRGIGAVGENEISNDPVTKPKGQLVGQVVVGITLVIFSSRFLIASVTVLAQRWGLSEVVISATLVALGTSLPELVVGMTAIYRGHPALLVGNVIGADILNVLFVVGASAAATPLRIVDETARIPEIFLVLHLPAMLIMLSLFLVYIIAAIRTGSFRRWYGVPLLLLYAAYVAALLTLGRTVQN